MSHGVRIIKYLKSKFTTKQFSTWLIAFEMFPFNVSMCLLGLQLSLQGWSKKTFTTCNKIPSSPLIYLTDPPKKFKYNSMHNLSNSTLKLTQLWNIVKNTFGFNGEWMEKKKEARKLKRLSSWKIIYKVSNEKGREKFQISLFKFNPLSTDTLNDLSLVSR